MKALKTWTTIFGVVACGLILALAVFQGCGDDVEDECEDVCNVVADCGDDIGIDVDFGSCVDECENGPPTTRDCVFNCDRGQSCADYGLCIIGCGFTDEGAALEENCRSACTKFDDCAGDLGIDVDINNCTNDCIAEDNDTQGCVFLCDTNDSCVEYGACALPCGLI